jgi:hypothetical protein
VSKIRFTEQMNYILRSLFSDLPHETLFKPVFLTCFYLALFYTDLKYYFACLPPFDETTVPLYVDNIDYMPPTVISYSPKYKQNVQSCFTDVTLDRPLSFYIPYNEPLLDVTVQGLNYFNHIATGECPVVVNPYKDPRTLFLDKREIYNIKTIVNSLSYDVDFFSKNELKLLTSVSMPDNSKIRDIVSNYQVDHKISQTVSYLLEMADNSLKDHVIIHPNLFEINYGLLCNHESEIILRLWPLLDTLCSVLFYYVFSFNKISAKQFLRDTNYILSFTDPSKIDSTFKVDKTCLYNGQHMDFSSFIMHPKTNLKLYFHILYEEQKILVYHLEIPKI